VEQLLTYFDTPSPLIPQIFGIGHPSRAEPTPIPACMSERNASPDISETTLLERVATGDPRAFDQLYTRWSPMLFGLVCKILNDPKEAEDALQEGFLHIWHKAASYDSQRSSPSTWAYMIFRNKAIDRIRTRERRSRGMEQIAREEPFQAAPSTDPEEGVEHNERRKVIKAALDTIPPDQREAVNLAFFSGLTQTEIAERLGAPLGTVKARIRRGLLKLADTLKGKL
jgi:RNA polymerase sigma-70 factor, ECF subfamily